MNEDFAKVMEQLKSQHASELANMPLPNGVEDFVRGKLLEQDLETILFMLKLSWVFGAQAGQQAVAQAQAFEAMQQRKPRIEA